MAAKKKPQREPTKRQSSRKATAKPDATEPAPPEAEASKSDAAAPEAAEQQMPAAEPSQHEPPQAQAETPQLEAAEAEAPEAEAVQQEAPQREVPHAQASEQEAPQVEAAGQEVAQADAAAQADEGRPSADAGPPEQAPEPAAARAEGDAAADAAPVAATEASGGAEQSEAEAAGGEEEAEQRTRAKPVVPGAHLEVDIVPEGVDPLGRGEEEYEDRYATEEDLAPPEPEEPEESEREGALAQPIALAAIDLAADARYRATGKRKTAIARVTLRPGSGTYLVNGRSLEEHFPRLTLQRNIRQPLEMVGYHERMDVVANLHGGGISAQAGALRHGVSRALLEADPNLRGELKRRGFLTRDSRAKERKKAGLKKARKRPQFSKR
jgi:small subunit ribosomal protein S9